MRERVHSLPRCVFAMWYRLCEMRVNAEQVHKMRGELLLCAVAAQVRDQLPPAAEILHREYELPVDMHRAQFWVIPYVNNIISTVSSNLLHSMPSILYIVRIAIILHTVHCQRAQSQRLVHVIVSFLHAIRAQWYLQDVQCGRVFWMQRSRVQTVQ